MSVSEVRLRRWECDGACGSRVDSPEHAVDHVPPGWASLKLSDEAAKRVSPDRTAIDLCPTCLRWAVLLLWCPERKVGAARGMTDADRVEWGVDVALADLVERGYR